MKSIVIPIAVGVLIAGGAIAFIVAGGAGGTGDGDQAAGEIERLAGKLRAIEVMQESLAKAVADLDRRVAAGPAAAAAPTEDAIERAVARALESRAREEVRKGGASAGPASDQGAEEGSAPAAPSADEGPIDLETAVASICDPRFPSGDKQRLWGRLREAGLLDQAVAAIEKLARENPQDPDLQTEAGNAFIQKLVTVNDIEKGVWALKADKSYDAALALDDRHWGARFSKAVSLSFWPAIMGKQPEAIRQFEMLIGQQETAPARPEFSQTYVFLGNLHMQQGNRDKAMETWRRGAALFPADPELADRLAAAEGK
jgi:tetratricopeptide (TPR) repeat protein